MTKNLTWHDAVSGRQLTANLPLGEDLINAIRMLCHEADIRQASFNIAGAVSMVTLGTYDQTQQVFVTATEKKAYEMIYCQGSVVPSDGKPFVFAKICLADEHGRSCGGHLFSETKIYHAEIELIEIKTPQIERIYNPATGLPEKHFF